MSSKDNLLGMKIHNHLLNLGLETPLVEGIEKINTETWAAQMHIIAKAQTEIMTVLGLDLKDDSLAETPQRIAKMYTEEIFYGLDYRNFPKCTTVKNKMKYDEVVNSNHITVHSVCEHHFQPFIGHASVAYIPGERILGLSKFNRVVDFFCRRPQIQERLTEQVSTALRVILETEDVAVVIRAEHYCVKLRGVQDANSDTVTSKLCGRFRSVPELRSEVLALSRAAK